MNFRIGAVITILATALTTFAAAGGTAAAAVARPAEAAAVARPAIPSAGSAHLRLVRVNAPASSPSAAQRANLAAMGISASSADAFEIQNLDEAGSNPPYCLDAQDTGSLAGQPGDKVQIWHCNGTANQLWFIANSNSIYSELVNDEYTSQCLNANDNGGIEPGSLVQLWNCSTNTQNEYWEFAPSGVIDLEELTSDPSDFQIVYLDAVNDSSSSINDGDPVQVWTYNGNLDEQWIS